MRFYYQKLPTFLVMHDVLGDLARHQSLGTPVLDQPNPDSVIHVNTLVQLKSLIQQLAGSSVTPARIHLSLKQTS